MNDRMIKQIGLYLATVGLMGHGLNDVEKDCRQLAQETLQYQDGHFQLFVLRPWQVRVHERRLNRH